MLTSPKTLAPAARSGPDVACAVPRRQATILTGGASLSAIAARELRPRPTVVKAKHHHEKDAAMLMTIALILLVLWLLGVVVFKVSAAVIHVLLIAAIVVGLVHLFRGRRA
jgi:hypothetical protein